MKALRFLTLALAVAAAGCGERCPNTTDDQQPAGGQHHDAN